MTLNPYKISSDPQNPQGNLLLETDDLSSRFFIEASSNLRWAWGRGSELDQQFKVTEGTRYEWIWDGWGKGKGRGTHREEETADHVNVEEGDRRLSVWPSLVPDLQTRLGFTFGNNAKDGSTVVGSGDLYGELVLGENTFRMLTDDGIALSFGPELAASFVTDRKAQDIHANFLAGTGFAASIKLDGELVDRGMFGYRVGWSRFETPDLISNTNEVERENSFAKFDGVSGWSNQFEFHLGLKNNGFLSAVGRFYHGSDPNPWSFQVGYSIPLGNLAKLVEGIGGTLGSSKKETTTDSNPKQTSP